MAWGWAFLFVVRLGCMIAVWLGYYRPADEVDFATAWATFTLLMLCLSIKLITSVGDSAQCFKDREASDWPCVLVTELTAREILGAKIRRVLALWRVLAIASAPAALHVAVCLGWKATAPLLALAFLVTAIPFVACLSFYFNVRHLGLERKRLEVALASLGYFAVLAVGVALFVYFRSHWIPVSWALGGAIAVAHCAIARRAYRWACDHFEEEERKRLDGAVGRA